MFDITDIMTREPYTLSADNNLSDARKLMSEHHIRHVPIIDAKGGLIGLVSQRDILAAETPRNASSTSNREPSEPTVTLGEIMTTPVDTLTENASLRGAALHLQKNKLGCLPVISDGKLVGIITDSDFVAVAINLMEQLQEVEAEESDDALFTDIDELT